jgi:hypothetical protein
MGYPAYGDKILINRRLIKPRKHYASLWLIPLKPDAFPHTKIMVLRIKVE